MMETLKKTEFQTDQPPSSYAEAGDVECDVCTERKHKAVKSCLVCLNSYCQNHFKLHEELHSGTRHKVIDATGRLQQMICPQHEKLLDIFCRTEQKCICCLCKMDEHKNHDTVSVEEERTEKQRQLEDKQGKLPQIIQEKEKKLQDLREAVKKRSAQTAVDDTERIFTELIQTIEKRRSDVTQLITDQEETAKGLLKQLEQEIDDLRRNDELEKLPQTDHISFLQSFQSLTSSSGSSDNFTVSSLLSFDNVRKSVTKLKEKIEDFCKEMIEKISGKEPKIQEDFLQYFKLFSLDPNTAHRDICLSEENRVASYTGTVQPYPDHPDRFDVYPQVLCSEGVSGRCYWEVEWSGECGVSISVSYKSISRKGKGNDNIFGNNDQSWSLFCCDSSCSFSHKNIEEHLPVVLRSSRIGVYVDHSAGSLSFYSVSDTMTLIHRANNPTFTKPLYPGFNVDYGSAVKLCDITI